MKVNQSISSFLSAILSRQLLHARHLMNSANDFEETAQRKGPARARCESRGSTTDHRSLHRPIRPERVAIFCPLDPPARCTRQAYTSLHIYTAKYIFPDNDRRC